MPQVYDDPGNVSHFPSFLRHSEGLQKLRVKISKTKLLDLHMPACLIGTTLVDALASQNSETDGFYWDQRKVGCTGRVWSVLLSRPESDGLVVLLCFALHCNFGLLSWLKATNLALLSHMKRPLSCSASCP